ARNNAGIDVKTAGPGRFRPRGQSVVLEYFTGHLCDVQDLPPRHTGHRVEIDAEFVGVVEVVGKNRMWVEVDAAKVDCPGQAGRVVDDGLFGRGTGGVAQFGDVDPVGPFLRRAFLKDGLLVDALDEPLQDHGSAGHPAQGAVGDREVVLD